MSTTMWPKKGGRSKSVKFGVCDIEARGGTWVDFLTIGFFDGRSFFHFEDLAKFICHIRDNFDRSTIFAHFGGKYDFNFIMGALFEIDNIKIESMIRRGSGLLSFTVLFFKSKEALKHGDYFKKIVFRDSSAILPFGLRSICESFGVAHKKLEIEYDKIDKITPELIEYLEHDCRGLYESIEKFYAWPLIERAGSSFTIAGQAINVLKLFLDDPLYSLSPSHDAFVRKSYFGGRTEIIRPLFEGKGSEKIRCYDVNSLYPYIMATTEVPNKFLGWHYKFNPKQMGFYECTIDVPRDMYIPPLPVVAKVKTKEVKERGKNRRVDREDKFEQELIETVGERLIFPTGRLRGVWTTLEINYALSLGCKLIKCHRAMYFENAGLVFEPYIRTLYKMRLEAQEKKDGVTQMICKLLMNSCYGRTGLRRESEELEFDYGQSGVKLHSEFMHKQNWIRIVSKDCELTKSFSNVAIASYITSAARIHLHKILLQAGQNIFYLDTDSCMTTHVFETSKELGGLKLEYEGAAACFLLPKTYMINSSGELIFETMTKNGKIKTNKKVVMKGFDKKKIAGFTFDDFKNALEGDLRNLKVMQEPKFATFKSAIRRGSFLKLLPSSERRIRSMYNKRKIIKTNDNFIYNTKPIYLKSTS